MLFLPLLCAFILFIRKKNVASGVMLGLVSVKPQFLPLFVIYYFLHRRIRLVIVCVVTIALITILPLVLTQRPVVETIQSWASLVAKAGGGINDPSPFISDSAAIISLQVVLNRVFNTASPLILPISWGIIALVGGYVVFLNTRGPASLRGELLNFGVVSTLSMLLLYHRSYDFFLLFPGAISVYLYLLSVRKRSVQIGWVLFLIAIIMTMFLPGDLFARLVRAYPVVESNYLFRLIGPFQAWATIALTAALVFIKRQDVRSSLADARTTESLNVDPRSNRIMSHTA